MNADQMNDLFREWWKESFPAAPVNKQTGLVCCAFAAYVLDVVDAMAEYDENKNSLN